MEDKKQKPPKVDHLEPTGFSNLKGYTSQQLLDEIKRRQEQVVNPPDMLATKDFNRLIRYVDNGMRDAAKDKKMPLDFSHYVYELVIEAMYGGAIWDWLRAQDWYDQ